MSALQLIALMAAGLAGVIYIARQARKAAKVTEAIAAIIQRELHPNGGASLHDKVTWIETQLMDTRSRLERIELHQNRENTQ